MSEQDLEELEEVEEWLSLQAYLSFLEQQEEAELSWCARAPGQIARPGSAHPHTTQVLSLSTPAHCGLPGYYSQTAVGVLCEFPVPGGVAYNVLASCPSRRGTRQ